LLLRVGLRGASLYALVLAMKEIGMKLFAPLLMTAALTAAFAAPAIAQDRKVTIVNNSGFTISYFYGSNVGTTFWEEDLLSSDVLSNGATVDINFDDTTGYCRFDLRAIFDDGTELVKKDVNLYDQSLMQRGNSAANLL
jgi:hypothetical protein